MTARLLYVCEGGDCTERGSGDLHDKIEHVVQTDPGGTSITTPIARRVTAFDISEGTFMVTVNLEISIPVSEEGTIVRSQSVNVTPRN